MGCGNVYTVDAVSWSGPNGKRELTINGLLEDFNSSIKGSTSSINEKAFTIAEKIESEVRRVSEFSSPIPDAPKWTGPLNLSRYRYVFIG